MAWRRANEPRHDRWREDLGVYAPGQLGQLGWRRSARLRAHLADCPTCGVELAELQEVVTWLGRLKGQLPGPDHPVGDQ